MNKEKGINKLFVIAYFTLILCFLLFLAITIFITKQNQANRIFYFNGTKMWQSPKLYIITIICLLVFPIILFLQLKKKIKNIILCMGLGTITVFLSIFIFLLFLSSGDRETRYYYFISPITGKDIIAEEWNWLLGGGVNFYEPINEERVHLIGNITTDNGYRPLANNEYFLKWSENKVIISYSFRGKVQNEIWKTETLKFNMTKQ